MGLTEYISARITNYKTRTVPTSKYRSVGVRYISGVPTSPYDGFVASGYGEETCSLNHPIWRYKKHIVRIGRDVGGPFFNRKVSVSVSQPRLVLSSGSGASRYEHTGFLAPLEVQRVMKAIQDGKLHTNPLWTSDNAMSRSALKAEGLKLMLSAIPTSPTFSLANSLGELISEQQLFGIPLKQFVSQGGHTVPGEYLNLQFGILPVVSDIQNYVEASKKSEAIMAQYFRDANRLVKRKRVKPTERTTTTTVFTDSASIQLLAAGGQVLATALGQPTQLTVTKKIERDVWFEGSFLYYIPPQAEEWYKKLRGYNAVYGILPTPETIWELTPFSWLADWFTNSQDIVRSVFVAGTDGSVPIRSYVMCRTHVVSEYTWSGSLRVNGSWIPHTLTWVSRETIKQRESARYYGVDWSGLDLSAKQLSILTALGLSRR